MAKVVKKNKSQMILPNRGDVLFQSNRITNGKWRGLTLIQSKILIAIIDQLQVAIDASMHGVDVVHQLNLFNEQEDGLLQIGIPLKEICRPDQYKYIHAQADELMTVKLYLKTTDGHGRYSSIINVFHRFDVPELENGIKTMKVYMNKDSARKLIEIDKNKEGKPINYTKFLKAVAFKAKNKYTYKLYMIIASWRVKGGFRIALKDLREQLGIEETKYKNFADFRRNVLEPVQEELKKNADCWFNCAEKGFFEEDKRSGRVAYLNFKVITKQLSDRNKELADHIKHLLRLHAGFTDQQIGQIEYIFNDTSDYEQVMNRILELVTYVKANSQEIKNKQAYIIKSLRNEFS